MDAHQNEATLATCKDAFSTKSATAATAFQSNPYPSLPGVVQAGQELERVSRVLHQSHALSDLQPLATRYFVA